MIKSVFFYPSTTPKPTEIKQTSPAVDKKNEDRIVDDTGFPKKGRHSLGVARQFCRCGRPGKQDNCQVAVSVSLASARGSLPVAYRLYLPQD